MGSEHVVRIGLIVDGESEYRHFRRVADPAALAGGHQIVDILFPGLQPKAPVGVIARDCRKALVVLREKRVDLAIVILDRENRSECPGVLATEIEQKLADTAVDVAVVVKNRMLENWLVADHAAVHSLNEFNLSRADIQSVGRNNADNCQATQLLRKAAARRYHKVADAGRILEVASIDAMAENSRSFRRFLRIAGHPDFSTQSRRPV